MITTDSDSLSGSTARIAFSECSRTPWEAQNNSQRTCHTTNNANERLETHGPSPWNEAVHTGSFRAENGPVVVAGEARRGLGPGDLARIQEYGPPPSKYNSTYCMKLSSTESEHFFLHLC